MKELFFVKVYSTNQYFHFDGNNTYSLQEGKIGAALWKKPEVHNFIKLATKKLNAGRGRLIIERATLNDNIKN